MLYIMFLWKNHGYLMEKTLDWFSGSRPVGTSCSATDQVTVWGSHPDWSPSMTRQSLWQPAIRWCTDLYLTQIFKETGFQVKDCITGRQGIRANVKPGVTRKRDYSGFASQHC